MRLNIDSHILNVVWWNLAYAGDWGDACHCSSGCDTCLVGSAKLLSVSPSHFISQRGSATCSVSMRSTASLFSPLTVTLQYFSIPITGTVGDPLLLTVLPATQVWLHVREQSHYGHSYTLLTLQCQPSLLIHDPQKLLLYMCLHLLSCIKHGCARTYKCSKQIFACAHLIMPVFAVSIAEVWFVWRAGGQVFAAVVIRCVWRWWQA